MIALLPLSTDSGSQDSSASSELSREVLDDWQR